MVDEPQSFTLAEFLERVPPNRPVFVTDATEPSSSGACILLNTPEIQLHCQNSTCEGVRVFRCSNDPRPEVQSGGKNLFLTYRCSNCRGNEKTFSFSMAHGGFEYGHLLVKFGKLPPFGPVTPSRLISLVGPDKELYLKGRRCENQGLGIGAFVYYRRVVENQKNRIIKEIIKVAKKENADEDLIKVLQSALNETQFSKAMEQAKNAIPESLLIDGRNPLKLLHGVLSEGVHALTDEKCLELAESIRVILTELSKNVVRSLRDKAEISRALSQLTNYEKG